MWRCFMKGRPFSVEICALFLLLAVSGLANCGGNGSNGQTGTGGGNSVPTISGLFPNCAPAGEQFVDSVNNQLTVTGVNFGASSVVRWNGSDRPTTLDPDSQNMILSAQISASDIASAGTAAVTVF